MDHSRAGLVFVGLAACTSSSQDGFTRADADALADRIVTDLIASQLFNRNALLDCQPEETTAPTTCASGGAVRSKIVIACPSPHPRECCSLTPPSCKEWGASNTGTIETTLEACKTSDAVTQDGTVKGGIAVQAKSTCAGDEVVALASVHLVGPYSACPEGLDVKAQITITLDDHSVITMFGKICGRDISIGKKVSRS